MSVKLKTITPTSWLVIGDTEDTKIGLLTLAKDEYILMVKGHKQRFLTKKAVNTYFSEDIFENVTDTITAPEAGTTYFINGYPVDFESPHEVIIKGNSLPLFSKKLSSEIYYSAGYFCLHFPKNWMPAYNPKLSTLENYEYVGPFYDEFTMKAELAKLRKLK